MIRFKNIFNIILKRIIILVFKKNYLDFLKFYMFNNIYSFRQEGDSFYLVKADEKKIIVKSGYFVSFWQIPVKRFPYHLVTPSPWPIFASLAILSTIMGLLMYMHFVKNGLFFLLFSLCFIFSIMYFWWNDIVLESTFQGMHTKIVQKGLSIGMLLFIVSEIMFFFAFFWAFFDVSLAPGIEIGCRWPPIGIEPFNAFGLPLLNTYFLLLSGVIITFVHHTLINKTRVIDDYILQELKNKKKSLSIIIRKIKLAYFLSNSMIVIGFNLVLLLAFLFTFMQIIEYSLSSFSISDGVFGSAFFMLTGFHGLHVIIGSIFIFVCFLRFCYGHFKENHHLALSFSIWYWHFVDIVWLFLFFCVYWWGSNF